jgi:conjugative transposon TraN protein
MQSCFAQNEAVSFIPSMHLNITFNKTTNLIFPYSVQSIDRGSKDILVQQPKGTENIVQLKAGKPDFIQTNLSVITSDGKLYSFTVDYATQPTELNIIVQKKNSVFDDSSFKQTVLLTSSNRNEALFEAVVQKINKAKGKRVKRDKKSEIIFDLNSVCVTHDVFYFQLQLKNNSNISYDIDNIRFAIKDKQQSKRTATQEIELTPVNHYGSFINVPSDSSSSCIVALSKFTLPDSKYLSIELLEKNGSRNLQLIIRSRQIMKAVVIN